MNNIMLDIETMGTDSSAAILSIAAVYFNPLNGETGDEFYEFVDLESCVKLGLKIDTDTLLWWLRQSDDARGKIKSRENNGVDLLPDVLQSLTDFIRPCCQMWGNGDDFDCVILNNAFNACNMTTPWDFWNTRDVRTIVELGKLIGINVRSEFPFEGVKHDALDDAKHQVKYTSHIINTLTFPYR